MNPHLALLANAFYAASTLLVPPSFLVLVLYAVNRLQGWFAPLSASTPQLRNPDAILLILTTITRVVGTFASVLGFLQQFVFNGMAIVALIIFAVGVGLFFVGHGLHEYSTWARITAGVLTAGIFLCGVTSIMSARGPLLGASIVAIAYGFYGMWVLWQKFPT